MTPEFKSKRWIVAEPIPTEVDRELSHYPPVFRQILFNRGVLTDQTAQNFLYGKGELLDPLLMKGMEEAAAIILESISRQKEIVIYGDYDVDGVTATALLVEGIRALGGNATPYIPNRFDEGYGLNRTAIEQLADLGAGLIITVDCGIRSQDEAELARALGVPMIITDHHHPLGNVPNADVVICPKQAGDEYPEKNLSGVGIAYKLLSALCLRNPACTFDIEEWLDLVALGTVADMVPLEGENRVLVRKGLNKLRFGKRIGIVSLANVSGADLVTLTASDIGFKLAPRLNAAGRLETAMEAYTLLTSKGILEAGLLAQKLDDRNRERQQQTRDMQSSAESRMTIDQSTYLLSIADAGFNSGVVGLVASRLAESHYRPAIVGAIADGEIRASCRSIHELHITQALDECADLMVRHGGHSAAAGFTVKEENWPLLVDRLEKITLRELGGLDLRPRVKIDAELPLASLKPELLDWIELLEPTGMSNASPIFCTRGVEPRNVKVIGTERTHLRFKAGQQNLVFDTVGFNMAAWRDNMPSKIDIAYYFEKNSWQGRTSLQLRLADLRPSD